MRRLSIIVTLILAVPALYFLGYRSLRLQAGSPSSPSTQVSILGIKIPYTAKTKEKLYRVYQPLIDGEASRIPTEEMSGTITRIDSAKLEFVVKEDGADGRLIHIPKHLLRNVLRFGENALVTIQFGRQAEASLGIRTYILEDITSSKLEKSNKAQMATPRKLSD